MRNAEGMYNPKGNGKQKTVQSVRFAEAEPPAHLSGIVHRFLELKTEGPLSDDYRFHALPDACTYIVFDQLNTDIAGVTKLRASSSNIAAVVGFNPSMANTVSKAARSGFGKNAACSTP